MSLADELTRLRAAFPPHPIDPTAAFAEWGGTHVDGEAFRQGVRGKSWTDLDAEFLEKHHDALVFLGPSSLAEFLPAYLSQVVSRAPALSAMPGFLLGTLTRDDMERFDARFAQFTPEQRQAVASTLAAYEVDVGGSSRQADVTRALDSYWRRLLGDAQ